ncbi:suppressor of fused domain protein [Nonomuraea jabiensis]|nr:suppressor of fused domain protein [Nonomuraea jabiensis]
MTSVDGHGLEFVLTARTDDWQHLESMTMNAYYHAGPPHQRLDHGHVVPIGRPWFADSVCDRYLISLPYPFGPDFEVCAWDGGHARILWLLPITSAERDLIMNAGLEAFESLLEEKRVDYTDPHRSSVA